jgi:hypothetical protein
MLDDALVRRGDCDGNPITEIAMRGIRRKPEEQGAEQPCPNALSVPADHTANDK